MKVFGVIMAGGRGTRFWPLSTVKMPKQFLGLLPGGTMLQLTADRLAALCGRKNVMVVTGVEYRDLVLRQLPWLSPDNLLLEPVARNTAPCIGWAAAVLNDRGHGESAMLVAPSDHWVEPAREFENTATLALRAAEKGLLVTMGIPPDSPATGYGYIRKGSELLPGVYGVDSFQEKPDATTAGKYLEDGGYFWNAGIFAWRVSEILAAIALHMPELSEGLKQLGGCSEPGVDRFSMLPSESVDVGVMEKAGNAAVVPASFRWSDIGDWPGARDAGVSRGEAVMEDSENVLVYDTTGRLTVVMGLSNVSVVCTENATLVMADSCAQKLRKLSDRLQ
jgi:mannose-1-phosphate guanylyltransferase